MQLKLLVITVKDAVKLEDSIAFYENIVGMRLVRRYHEGEAELGFLTDDNGDVEIELVCMPQMKSFGGHGFFLCFLTENLDALHKLAHTEGFHPSEIRQPSNKFRYFYVYDPNGVSVQLREIIQ